MLSIVVSTPSGRFKAERRYFLLYYRLETNFSEGIVFSHVCDFFFFFFCLFTQKLLKGLTNPNQIFTREF